MLILDTFLLIWAYTVLDQAKEIVECSQQRSRVNVNKYERTEVLNDFLS